MGGGRVRASQGIHVRQAQRGRSASGARRQRPLPPLPSSPLSLASSVRQPTTLNHSYWATHYLWSINYLTFLMYVMNYWKQLIDHMERYGEGSSEDGSSVSGSTWQPFSPWSSEGSNAPPPASVHLFVSLSVDRCQEVPVGKLRRITLSPVHVWDRKFAQK